MKSALKHTAQVTVFIFIVTLLLNVVLETVGEDALAQILGSNSALSVVVAAIVGLIPNCAASVVIADLYVEGVLGAGAMFAGLLVSAGVGLLVLFRANRRLKQKPSSSWRYSSSSALWQERLSLLRASCSNSATLFEHDSLVRKRTKGHGMKLLEERIKRDGVVKSEGVLKVDSFLNHQIDVNLIDEMGAEFARLFADAPVNKILTIEASGIGIVRLVARHFGNACAPVVFARKAQSINLDGDVLHQDPVVHPRPHLRRHRFEEVPKP